MKGNVYLVVHDLTFYFNEYEKHITFREINLLYQHADYIYIQNEFGHWQFLKNRSFGLDGYEYFERKDLLDKIPLSTQYQNHKSLYKCRPIRNAESAYEAINLWRKRREYIDGLKEY